MIELNLAHLRGKDNVAQQRTPKSVTDVRERFFKRLKLSKLSMASFRDGYQKLHDDNAPVHNDDDELQPKPSSRKSTTVLESAEIPRQTGASHYDYVDSPADDASLGVPQAYVPYRDENRSLFSISLSQLGILMRKNVLIAIRNPFSSIMRLLFPSLLLLLLFVTISGIGISSDAIVGPNPQLSDAKSFSSDIPHCSTLENRQSPCRTLLYSPSNSRVAYDLMKTLAARNEPPLTIGEFGDESTTFDIVAMPSYNRMRSFFGGTQSYDDDDIDVDAADGVGAKRRGSVNDTITPLAVGGYAFDCVTEQEQPTPMPTPGIFPTFAPTSATSPTPAPTAATDECYNVQYYTDSTQITATIVYYSSVQDPFTNANYPGYNFFTTMKLAIDRATIEYKTNNTINLRVSQLPLPNQQAWYPGSSSARALNIEVMLLPAVLFIGFFAYYVSSNTLVTNERVTDVRDGLRVVGVLNGPYWLSFALTELVWATLATGVACAVGYAAGFQFYTLNFGVALCSTLLLALNSSASGLLAAAFLHRPALAMIGMTVTFLFAFLLAITSNIINGLAILPSLFWGSGLRWWSVFGYVQNFVAIISIAQQIAVAGAARSTSQHVSEKVLWSTLDSDDKYTISTHALLMVMDYFLCIFGAWYLDSCFPGKTGKALPLSFLFQPSYWTVKRSSESVVDLDEYSESNLTSVIADLDVDVNREAQAVMSESQRAQREQRESRYALEIIKLSKTYRGGRIRGGGDSRALDMLTLGGERGSVLALLGHNGSGKSTTVNIISGLITPSFGEAIAFGHPISTQVETVQQMLGVCPQTNVLWESLTCAEHVAMFARVKRVVNVEAEIKKRLQLVNLYDVKDRYVHTFSGGMKRRLMFALAMVGDPKILILDEPRRATEE